MAKCTTRQVEAMSLLLRGIQCQSKPAFKAYNLSIAPLRSYAKASRAVLLSYFMAARATEGPRGQFWHSYPLPA
jgi:hypothetical protein